MILPQVAAGALLDIHKASLLHDSNFEVRGQRLRFEYGIPINEYALFSHQICAVVSQPGKPRGRGNKSTPLPTPVEQAAREVMGLSEEAVLCPRSAREVI